MAFSICFWANYIQGKTKLSRKSENAVADDRVLSFFMTPTYVMLNPQCDVTGNTRMVA